ncbi:extracellular solute-binding protein [Streptomyces sp. NBC_01387]|uniref:ABC transporter substrate-binding protein n=1 Tax=unclassified Streptomyces TaxID=2593676 RepID=UPI002253FB8B|nr:MULTISPECIES: extracellular solute-binding protein [unclassified Streptomyces]MCX4550058.1 extracellular solute-binding protein [Streptomyces sp. NBC_01500]WSC21554.1 extracellular solute-binding protein [Streptomyces sp. NBC_01766]WSV55518.1 extracellular solute-binding protein [Streptomyces sp. NBC_01014]
MTAVLSGCGSDSGPGDVTLKVVAANYDPADGPSNQQYWDKLAAAFEAKNPHIKVDVSVYPWPVVDAKVAAMVKSGHAPDIAQIGSYSDYAAAGKLYSADDLLSIAVQSNFLSSLSDAGEQDRVQYGLPFVASTRLLFYNEKMFANAGIKPPKTWAELKADAEVLKAQGVKYPYALPLGPEEAQVETMQWMLSGNGGYTDGVGTYTLDSAENAKTFNWLKNDLVGAHLTGPVAPAEFSRKQAYAAFTKGEVGMLNGHPQLVQQAVAKGVKVGMVSMPGINGPAKSATGVADWIMGFKQNGHREEIGKFLNDVFSDKNVLDLTERYNLLPSTTSASGMLADEPKYKFLKTFLDQLPTAQLPPVGKTSWSQVSTDVKKEIGKAVRPGGNPVSVLNQLQTQASTAQNAE